MAHAKPTLPEPLWDHDHKARRCSSQCDRQCVAAAYHEIPDTPPCNSQYFAHYTPKCLSAHNNQSSSLARKCCMKFPDCEAIPEEVDDMKESLKESSPLLCSAPVITEIPVPPPPIKQTPYWRRLSTYVWLFLGYPLLAVVHCLAIFLSWILVFTIPVSKMNARTLKTILLIPPEEVKVRTVKKPHGCETRVLLCCYRAFNWYYYKYTVDGINVFAVNLLPMVIITLVIGYVDKEDELVSSEAKFSTALISIIPLSYYIGMGIASISAQSNFAVGAVVNATFGSITEMAFYITALLQGHRAGSKCYAEIVKSALTGTLLGCILFVPGICMIIGGFKHREQRFNSRSAGVSSALLFISVGGERSTCCCCLLHVCY
ncbi:hypothetical protein DNTS_018897 [Danionella cerebrum]|uniref:Sodium/calcium exchanger membrane region domain-containing protein n=1 Tax=Danionella cerebrum TaxID=2873325 RepID=A0A553MUA1_9TELE|nr:hypothetical protein DNTS_018897 [Danionella translucida]